MDATIQRVLIEDHLPEVQVTVEYTGPGFSAFITFPVPTDLPFEALPEYVRKYATLYADAALKAEEEFKNPPPPNPLLGWVGQTIQKV